MKIKKNDTVLIQVGKDHGKTGKVTRAIPKNNKIVIAGLNTAKKHVKPSRRSPQGGIIDLSLPLNVSNVTVICPRCNKATKVGYKIVKNTKTRICKKCNESLDQ
jgi:large subunit ribosomal protein L24